MKVLALVMSNHGVCLWNVLAFRWIMSLIVGMFTKFLMVRLLTNGSALMMVLRVVDHVDRQWASCVDIRD